MYVCRILHAAGTRMLLLSRTRTKLRRQSLQCSWISSLDSGAICGWTSNNRTCHTAVLDRRWRRFYLVHVITAQCEPPFSCVLEMHVLLLTLLTYSLTLYINAQFTRWFDDWLWRANSAVSVITVSASGSGDTQPLAKCVVSSCYSLLLWPSIIGNDGRSCHRRAVAVAVAAAAAACLMGSATAYAIVQPACYCFATGVQTTIKTHKSGYAA